MQEQPLNEIARNMVQMHGLRAQAVAAERASEAQAQGDAAGRDRWQAVQTLIGRMKETGAGRVRAA